MITDDFRLRLYNEALRELGQPRLTSLSEPGKTRETLDDIWQPATHDFAIECLAEGTWNFAMRSVYALQAADVEPVFGFDYAYEKPDDFVRLDGIYDSPWAEDPLKHDDFRDENGYWFTCAPEVWISFVSSDADYGLDASRWPTPFRRYVATLLAARSCRTITGQDADRLDVRAEVAKRNAQSADGMNEGARFLRKGNWAKARMRHFPRGDRFWR